MRQMSFPLFIKRRKMEIYKSEFVTSSVNVSQCPKPDRPEYAFIGRSNVGKSSLINRLAKRKKLAKTSGSPGKTITINHYNIDNTWYLVDLPGYGYAKRSKTERRKWNTMVQQYILMRSNLLSLFVLVDVRLEPQSNDLEFIDWLGISQIPFVLVFTKADKLGKPAVDKNVAAFKRKLSETWEELPPIIITSAQTGTGREELLNYIEKTNRMYREQKEQ